MTDAGCVPFETESGLGWLCRGPKMEERYTTQWGDGELWCFVCRKRRTFTYSLLCPVEPSYYGPIPMVRCDVCRTSDGDVFPGRERMWEEP